MRARRCVAVLAALLAWPFSANAADLALGTGPDIEVHGFVSPGFLLTTDNNYLARSKRGSFEFSEVGINFTAPLTDKLRWGVQLFARDLGRTGNYSPKADWFYLDYRFEDWIGLRAGRVKIPFGLYNDTSDIDVARVPVLLPQSIYSLQNRDFLLAQTGFELYGRVNAHSLGALEYRMYGGTIFLDPTTQGSVQGTVNDIDIPYVAGQRLLWETPIEGLRGGVSLQALRLDADFLLPSNKVVSIRLPAVLWVWSLEYAAGDLLLSAEYSRWKLRVEATDPALAPPGTTTSERAYVMGSYRVTNWLQPGLYYSMLFPNVDHRSGPAGSQHDIAATLRFDVNPHWLVKLEGHYMNGTAELSTSLNDNRPKNTLERSWGVFLVKTTAHF